MTDIKIDIRVDGRSLVSATHTVDLANPPKSPAGTDPVGKPANGEVDALVEMVNRGPYTKEQVESLRQSLISKGYTGSADVLSYFYNKSQQRGWLPEAHYDGHRYSAGMVVNTVKLLKTGQCTPAAVVRGGEMLEYYFGMCASVDFGRPAPAAEIQHIVGPESIRKLANHLVAGVPTSHEMKLAAQLLRDNLDRREQDGEIELEPGQRASLDGDFTERMAWLTSISKIQDLAGRVEHKASTGDIKENFGKEIAQALRSYAALLLQRKMLRKGKAAVIKQVRNTISNCKAIPGHSDFADTKMAVTLLEDYAIYLGAVGTDTFSAANLRGVAQGVETAQSMMNWAFEDDEGSDLMFDAAKIMLDLCYDRARLINWLDQVDLQGLDLDPALREKISNWLKEAK